MTFAPPAHYHVKERKSYFDTVLSIDSSPSFSSRLQDYFKEMHINFFSSDNPLDIAALVEQHKPDVLFLDINLLRSHEEIFAALKKEHSSIMIIITFINGRLFHLFFHIFL